MRLRLERSLRSLLLIFYKESQLESNTIESPIKNENKPKTTKIKNVKRAANLGRFRVQAADLPTEGV